MSRPTSSTNINKKVLRYLVENFPTQFRPKQIAKALNMKQNSVRSAVRRLEEKGEIKKTHHGFYSAKITPELIKKLEIQQIRMHGLKIEWRSNFDTRSFFIAHKKFTFSDYKDTYHFQFEGRRVVLSAHKMGLVEVWLSCDDQAITFIEFTRYVAWLKGLLGDTMFYGGKPKLKQIGINIDLQTLHLDGVKNITLHRFVNAWSRIYQKREDMLRIETHLTLELELGEALNILQTLQPIDRFVKDNKQKAVEDFNSIMFG